MATVCVWSFPEVAGQVVELQDHQGEGVVHLRDAPSTGLPSQVGEPFSRLSCYLEFGNCWDSDDLTFLLSVLPPSGSWQDLKDHMREAGDVCYAYVHRDCTGVVQFVRKEDVSYAVRKLDNIKFRSLEVG